MLYHKGGIIISYLGLLYELLQCAISLHLPTVAYVFAYWCFVAIQYYLWRSPFFFLFFFLQMKIISWALTCHNCLL